MADREKEGVTYKCAWDGDPHTFQDYIRRVRLAFERTRKKRRRQLGPELVSQLTGRAWIITQEVDHSRLIQEDGAQYLIEYLEMKLGRTPVPAAGTFAEELFVKLRRPHGMTMSTWCSQVREAYRRLQRALKRARIERGEVSVPVASSSSTPKAAATPPGTSPSRSARRGSHETVPEPQAEETASGARHETSEVEGEDTPTNSAKGKGKGWWKGPDDSSSSSDQEAAQRAWEALDQGLPEVLPSELLGWLMLRRCSLTPAQRLTVLSSVGNSLKADDIERGLRGAEEDLRLHDREEEAKGKGRGKHKPRSNFWIEADGEWGLLTMPEVDEEDIMEVSDIAWIGKDIGRVYAVSHPPMSLASSPPVMDGSDGFWHQEFDGGYTWWNQAEDGEHYYEDPSGTFWAWSEYEQNEVMWSATPEQAKEISEAFAAYEGKLRNFQESRQLLHAQKSSRGYYPKGSKGGKSGKGKGKNKGKPVFVADGGGPSHGGQVMAAVGSAAYTGCFACGSRDHGWQSCPKRSSTSAPGGKGGKARSVFMVQEVVPQPEGEEECEGLAFSIVPTGHVLMSEVSRPELEGFGVIDSGATETVGGLEALEHVYRRRTEKMGHTNHVHVMVGCPPKTFRFGNGATKPSESYVLLMQSLGEHSIAVGVHTLAAVGVPILIGIKTLAKLGAVLDTQLGVMILKAVDADLIVPLRRSATGHLLIDLCSNWLDGGSKVVEKQNEKQGSSSSAFMVHEIEKKVQHEGREVMSASGVFRSHAHGWDNMETHDTSPSENVEHRQYQIPRSIDSSFCTLSGSGDVFGVEVNTDGMTQSLTPLLPASQVGDPSSMKALISLTRTCGESASLTSSHGDFNAGSFQGRTCSQESIPQEGRQDNPVGGSLRRQSSSGARSPRPSDGGSSMYGKSSTGPTRPGVAERLKRLSELGSLPAVQTTVELYPGVRLPRDDTQPGAVAARYLKDGEEAGTRSSLSSRNERQNHCLHCSGGELGGQTRECQEAEATSLCGAYSSTTSCGPQDSAARRLNKRHLDGSHRIQEVNKEGRHDSRRIRRTDLLESSVFTKPIYMKAPSFGVRDVYLSDYNMTANSAETFVQQYIKATEGFQVEKNDIATQNDPVLEENEMDLEQSGCWMALTEKHKVMLENKAYDLRQDVEEATLECVPEPSRPVDVMELCCEMDSLLVKTVEQMGGTGIRLGLFNGYNLLSDAGLQRVLEAIRRYRPKVLWVSMPCGATSPIQHLNELTPEAWKKSQKRRSRSKKLVKNGVRAMAEQIWLGGEVLQEWPFPNDAWKQKEIVDFWNTLSSMDRCETIRLDGCAVGLRVDEGFMKKPWMLKSSSPGTFSQLSRRCDGTHQHVPTLGTLARRSALYTPQMCRLAARGILKTEIGGVFGSVEVKPDYEALKTLTPQELEKLHQSIWKLHKLCGHPSNKALMKTLAARGADGKTLAAAENLRCMDCHESKMTTPGPTVSLNKEETLWNTLQIDSFTYKHGETVHHFLLMLDEASGFSVVQQVMQHGDDQHENLSTSATVETLERSWIQYFGYPARIRLDLEGAFRGTALHDWCAERGVELVFVPAEHHESTGDVERSIGELKKKMTAFLRSEDATPERAAWSMCAAHNHVARVGGYSPAQWAFGRNIPELENMAAVSSMADPAHAMSSNLRMRQKAESLYKELQAKAKISRALNSKVQKSSQFLPGDLVFYKRHKVPADFPAHQLVGRVLACETKLEEDGVTRAPTTVVWFIAQGRLKKAHSSQLRHASDREKEIAESTLAPTMPWTFTSLGRTLSQGQFEDLTMETFMRPSTRGRSATPARGRSRSRGKLNQGLEEPPVPSTKEPLEAIQREREVESIPGPQKLLPPQTTSGTSSSSSSPQLPQDQLELLPVPPTSLQPQLPEETVDIDVDKLLDDPHYLPMKRLPYSPLQPQDFGKSRRQHEPRDSGLMVSEGEGQDTAIGTWWNEEIGDDWVLGVSIPIPSTEAEWKKILKNPSKFTSKSVLKGAEVSWNKLNEDQRRAMAEAKRLEVEQWVVRKVVQKYRGMIPPSRLMKSRWVLTFKSVDNDPHSVKAKARIVLLGYSDPDLGSLSTSAPTLTRRSRQLLFGLSTHRRWSVTKADAKSAFLQGGPTQQGREVFIVPVPELSEALGLPPGEGAKLLRAAYGLVSAPREWFGEVDEVLVNQCGMKRMVSDPCVWIKQSVVQGRLCTVGYIGSHVDDFLISGNTNNKDWLETVEVFKRSFIWSPWESTPYTHCGVGITQLPDFGFQLQHEHYCSEINQIEVNPKEAEITTEEMTQARAVLGAIQWRAIQSGPQHLAKLSYLQSALPRGGKDVLQQINKLCREVHAQRFLSVATKQLGAERDDQIGFACWTDAAVGNRPDMGSTGGYLVGMVHTDFFTGKRGPVNPIAWRSGKLPRIARSSLSAEVQSLAEGEQEMMLCRAAWGELLGGDLDPRMPEKVTSSIQSAVIIDAKSVYDAFYKGDVVSSAYSMKEKYAGLELLAVSENLRKQNTSLLWVSSEAQLADSLTKSAAQDMMRQFLQGGQLWVVKYDPGFVAAKRKRKLPAPSEDVEPCCEPEPAESFVDFLVRLSHESPGNDFWGMSEV